MDMFHGREEPLAEFQEGGAVSETDAALANVVKQYPRLQGHNWSVIDSRGKGMQDDRQLEFYGPDEPDSPTPGRPTIEVFRPDLKGPALEQAIYGDMLHHLPAVDPQWQEMRQRYRQLITPEQAKVDQQAYQQEGEQRPYEDWMDQSRLDAHIRGRLAPDENDEWGEWYTPQQQVLLDQMEDHLTQPVQHYQHGGTVQKIQQQIDDPEHGSWHDDGKYHYYTPHPSFFAEVDPRDLVSHFDQFHPEDHKLNLP